MRLRLSLAIVALLVMSAAASAQQVSTGAPQAGAPAVTGKGKLAFINTDLFQQNVFEFKAKIDALNKQYEPRVKEVQGIADRITALENTLKTQSQVLTPARVAEMTEQLDGLKREYQRKAEDLQAEANRARDKAFEPITAKLEAFARDYTAKRGITMLIDIGNAVESGTVLWFDQRADVTQDFINEYNKANPVPTGAAPAAPASPAPKKP